MGVNDLSKRYSLALLLAIAISFIIFLIGLILIIVAASSSSSDKSDCLQPEKLVLPEKLATRDERAFYNAKTKEFELYRSRSKTPILKARLGLRIDNENLKEVTTKKTSNNNLEIKFITKLPSYLVSNTTLKISSETIKTNDYEINCDRHDWSFDVRLEDQNQEFEDCFKLDGAHWYGGAQSFDQQYWPINNQTYMPHKPYLTGIFDESGAVLERYWLSSNGVAIIGDPASPLFISMDKSEICLLVSDKTPFNKKNLIKLQYDVCTIENDPSFEKSLRSLHLEMIRKYYDKPIGIPDELMFKSPIWSTWAIYKRDINESVVLDFGKEILANKYTHCQLEIDDEWAPKYGDFFFDTKKFPNATGMIMELNALGFRTTLWTHPFANVDSTTFMETAFKPYWVRAADGYQPAFTFWWCGVHSAIIDATNPEAADWFISELNKMLKEYGLDSYKFDAGETIWLPKLGSFKLFNEGSSPINQYTTDYVRMTARINSMIEVRSAYQSQDVPIFVRMIDKDSRWGFDNGLKSVITTGLIMSILGYPYVLPDMIGGNAYDYEATGEFIFPDYELFIRWAQVTAFMPSMQFSIPPWFYNDKTTVPVNDICREAVRIHEEVVFPVIMDAAKMSVDFGIPIMRPLWWIDSNDVNNLVIYDEYFVGDSLLVAPVLDRGVVKRDIYLPKGSWKDGNNATQTYVGPRWLRDYPAGIDVIPYFIST